MALSARPPSATFGGRRRFSSTFRLAKMPRSSGQSAMPSRAMRFDGSPAISVPLYRIEPARRTPMPMIDFSVVVLPAPLRPSSVTTSPAPILKSTPWSTCDSPYQALSFSTESSVAASGMRGPEVRLDHLRIGGYRRVVALGDHLAPREHGDPV